VEAVAPALQAHQFMDVRNLNMGRPLCGFQALLDEPVHCPQAQGMLAHHIPTKLD
jgi:hypothetical protein